MIARAPFDNDGDRHYGIGRHARSLCLRRCARC
jgi:hypothetical protein